MTDGEGQRGCKLIPTGPHKKPFKKRRHKKNNHKRERRRKKKKKSLIPPICVGLHQIRPVFGPLLRYTPEHEDLLGLIRASIILITTEKI